jgi:hypothetical protein
MSELPLDYTKFADTLGQALDDADTNFFLPSAMRLRMQYCGVTALAISESLRSIGYDAQAVISSPKLAIDSDMRHAMTRVETSNGPVLIDATYSQFMGYVGVGLYPRDAEYYPEQQVIEFPLDEAHQPVDILIECTRRFRQAIVEKKAAPTPFSSRLRDVDEPTVRRTLSEIWNPHYFSTYRPRHKKTIAMGRQLAEKLKTDLL